MNIYSVIVTLLICVTVIYSLFLLLKQPICIKIIHKEEKTPINSPIQTVETKEETPEVERPVEPKNMDAVIAAVNDLMGIDITEEE